MASGVRLDETPANNTRRQWTVLALLVASVAINYIDRGNLSVAGRDLSAELRIAPDRLGLLFSAFFWTYALFQIAAGWLVDRYDVLRVFAAGYLVWSAATVCTGLVSTVGALFAVRLLLGMSESVAYPSYAKIIAANFREERRGIANALIDAGSRGGPFVGVLAGGLLLEHYGWRVMFLAIGAASFLWLAPWMMLAPKLPRAPVERHTDGVASFGEILRHREAWGTFVGLYAGNYAWYFLLTWLPPYLLMERHYSRHSMAIYGGLPYLAAALSSLAGGWFSDRLIRRGLPPTVRRRFATLAFLASALLLVAACICRDERLAMGLLILACIALAQWSAQCWAITQTLAGPARCGKWVGLQNGFGNVAGITVPWITGEIVQRTGSFYPAFIAVGAVLVVGAAAYHFLIPCVAPVRWNPSDSGRM
jgi:MFS family permease